MPEVSVTAYFKLNHLGQYTTDVVVDGKLIKTIPTHPSQIPIERESLLWKPDPIATKLKKLSTEAESVL
jgi:hypothetical protein